MRDKLTTLIASAALITIASAPPALAAATHGAKQASLPTLLAGQIRAVNRAKHAPDVLLPRSLPLGAGRLYASGGPSGAGYALSIGAVRNCGDADACFVAEFSAARAHTVFGRPVNVRGASKAGFFPLSCGASCSPPQIDFLIGGTRYTIQANLDTRHGDRRALIAAAESAISAGPR
jgi:hypothetical protein